MTGTQLQATAGDACREQAPRRIVMRGANLRKSFGGQVVLNSVSFELREGECVALVGPNGSGKTTLENILSGNLEPDSGKIELLTNGTAENFSFPRPFWQNVNPFDHFTPERLAWEGVSKTWQEVRLFPTQSLLDNIAVGTPKQLGENPLWSILRKGSVRQQESANQEACRGILVKLGLNERAASSGDKISLGQSKRVAIARAVRTGARILFLDEPLAGLDSAGIREVLLLLNKLLQEDKLTLVIIEHAFNLPCVLGLATKVWSLQDGGLSEETKEAFTSRTFGGVPDDVERLIRGLVPPGASIRHEQMPGGAILSRSTPPNANGGDPVLEIEDVVVYRGKRLVIGEQLPNGHFQGLSLTLRRGETGFLQAPNGWGKTTLLEAIAGIRSIARGTIRLGGQPVQNLETWQRANLGMGFLQARQNCFPNLTVRESLRASRVPTVPPGLNHLLNRRVCNLSGGERQRLALVCLFDSGLRLVNLLDEPFACLDRETLLNGEWWSGLAHNGANFVALPHSSLLPSDASIKLLHNQQTNGRL